MKIKDDKGTHFIPDVWGVTYISMRDVRPYIGSRRKKKQEWMVDIAFGRDVELMLHYEKKADAQAAFDKLVKRIKEEYK